jgi:hypothetical protein
VLPIEHAARRICAPYRLVNIDVSFLTLVTLM